MSGWLVITIDASVLTMNLQRYGSRDAASAAAAALVTGALSARLSRQAEASLVVSGGRTPAASLSRLAATPLDWDRVAVTLTDERCVPVDDDASNERMVRQRLLRDKAAGARFARLDDDGLASLPRPFACSLIGMGEDGHFASLFPDMDGLDAALDLDGPAGCVPVRTAASPHGRVSMTLALLAQSDLLLLLAFGEAKLAVLEEPDGLPAAALLRQRRAPLQVIWAP